MYLLTSNSSRATCSLTVDINGLEFQACISQFLKDNIVINFDTIFLLLIVIIKLSNDVWNPIVYHNLNSPDREYWFPRNCYIVRENLMLSV